MLAVTPAFWNNSAELALRKQIIMFDFQSGILQYTGDEFGRNSDHTTVIRFTQKSKPYRNFSYLYITPANNVRSCTISEGWNIKGIETILHILPVRRVICYVYATQGNIGNSFNPFKPEFSIVIFIHYKPRIAAAIIDLQWMRMIWVGWKIKENYHVLVNQFHWNFHSKTPSCIKIKSVFRDVKWCFNASWGLKGLNLTLTTLKCVYINHGDQRLIFSI